jgi:hypothetical protein
MPVNMGIHWSEDQLRLHLSVDASTSVAVLAIRNVQESDQAIYRCHVDFSNSQSRHYFFNLTVISELSLFYYTNRLFELRTRFQTILLRRRSQLYTGAMRRKNWTPCGLLDLFRKRKKKLFHTPPVL